MYKHEGVETRWQASNDMDGGIVQTTNSKNILESVKTGVVSITRRSVVQIHPPQPT